jgi:putative ABC transport system permease protein
MKTIALALRNLLRNRRRSFTTLLAMMIGTSAILLFGGYSRNINYGLQTGFVQRSGHLQIQHKDYFLYGSANPSAYGIVDYQTIIDTVQHDPVLSPMLKVVTPTLQVGGIAGNFAAGMSRTVIGTGVVVEGQNRMREWNDYAFPLAPNPFALTGTGPDAAVIGMGVARVLQLCGPLKVPNCPQARASAASGGPSVPADIAALSTLEKPDMPSADDHRIEMLAANSHGVPNVVGLNVIKAANQGVKELDDIYVAMHLAKAQRLVFGGAPPEVTAIVLQLQHTNQMRAAKARLEQLLSATFKDRELEVQEFTTLNPSYAQITGMFAAIFSFITVLIGAIVLFTIANTMSMAVMERTAEIGTLRAIGLRRAGIRRLFISEGLMLGVIGAGLGILVAIALAALVNLSGLTWTPPGQTTPTPLTIRVWGEPGMILGCAALLIKVSMLSAWWPARRAAAMDVVDALRHV